MRNAQKMLDGQASLKRTLGWCKCGWEVHLEIDIQDRFLG